MSQSYIRNSNCYNPYCLLVLVIEIGKLHNDNNTRKREDIRRSKKQVTCEGLSLIGMLDKEIIFNMLKPDFHTRTNK